MGRSIGDACLFLDLAKSRIEQVAWLLVVATWCQPLVQEAVMDEQDPRALWV